MFVWACEVARVHFRKFAQQSQIILAYASLLQGFRVRGELEALA
jgi:hypothetical protein